MTRWLIVSLALCTPLAVTAAEAAGQQRTRSGNIVVRGCTKFVPPACVGVDKYALFGASPRIPQGVGVDVVGTPGGPSICGGATGLRVVSWRQNNRIRCKT